MKCEFCQNTVFTKLLCRGCNYNAWLCYKHWLNKVSQCCCSPKKPEWKTEPVFGSQEMRNKSPTHQGIDIEQPVPKKKRNWLDYEESKPSSTSSEWKEPELKTKQLKLSDTGHSLSVLFIPFDAGGTSRTQKGLSNSGTRGEIFLQRGDTFFRMPYDPGFEQNNDLQEMKPLEETNPVKIETAPQKSFPFRPEGPKRVLSKIENKKTQWDINYEVIVCAAVDKLGDEHDRNWEKSLFKSVATKLPQSAIVCKCIHRHTRRPWDVPRVFPDLIFLSEEQKNNKFPEKLFVHSVEYRRMEKSALDYNKEGGLKDWKQQIAGYVRSTYRNNDEREAEFSAKRAVIDCNEGKENVLLVTKDLRGIKLVACGVHFSSKYVNLCKNNATKARQVLDTKLEWSKTSGADLLIGDFNFDCSFEPQFMPEYVSGPQFAGVGNRVEKMVSTRASNTSQEGPLRFMNAVVTNDSTKIEPNHISREARPVIGDQSLESGYYSDHPWIFVTVSKEPDEDGRRIYIAPFINKQKQDP